MICKNNQEFTGVAADKTIFANCMRTIQHKKLQCLAELLATNVAMNPKRKRHFDRL
jgi:hypothetical protein